MSLFHCQQFTVRQQHAAMKICTDSLLFGAMAPISPGDQVLDIGTGTGLLALMAAQLGGAAICAVEICPDAAQEAEDNFRQSQWHQRLNVMQQSIQQYALHCNLHYDVIISNPPFFAGHLPAPTPKRNLARHADALPYADLFAAAAKLLSDAGVFYTLLPLQAITEAVDLAQVNGLYLNRQTHFRGFADKPAKVAALSFSRGNRGCVTDGLTVYQSDGVYTLASKRYLQPFLLRFKEDA